MKTYCTECPSEQMISPCDCLKHEYHPRIIYFKCGGNENFDLKHIFNEMSINLDEGNKSFTSFYLNNTAISELSENVFGNITFGEIIIENAYKFSRIHSHAFRDTNNYLTIFRVYSTPLDNQMPYYDFFTAISLMPRLSLLTIANTSVTEITDNAFRPLSGIQYNLTTVSINDHKLKKLCNNAFEYWPSLTDLNLANNTLNHISENAFNFQKRGNVPVVDGLRLILIKNNLNSSSFEIGAFNGLNKPTHLFFSYGPNDKTNITYLDRHVFEPFVSDDRSGIQSNRIEMLETLDCDDCRNYWLVGNENYKTKAKILKCSNHKMLTDSSNFKRCTS